MAGAAGGGRWLWRLAEMGWCATGSLAAIVLKTRAAVSLSTKSPRFGASGNYALEAHNQETAMQPVAIDLGGSESLGQKGEGGLGTFNERHRFGHEGSGARSAGTPRSLSLSLSALVSDPARRFDFVVTACQGGDRDPAAHLATRAVPGLRRRRLSATRLDL